MSVRLKLVVIIVFVALVPLTVSAFSTFGIHQSAFDRNLAELHRKTAEQEATRLQAQLDGITRGIQLLATNTISWAELTEDERDAALWLVYRQSSEVVMVLLLDEKGDQFTRPAYVDPTTAAEEPDHPPVPKGTLEKLVKHVPLKGAKLSQVEFGELFTAPGVAPILPIALGVVGAAPSARWVVAVGISLRAFCRDISRVEHFEILVVDTNGRAICSASGAEALSTVDPAFREHISGADGVQTYRNQEGVELVAATAEMKHGWQVVAQQPAALAYSASSRIRKQTIFWIAVSLVVALAAGLFLSRTISRPIQRLVAGVRELAKGNVKYRLRMKEADEFGRLGRAFDTMSEEIAARDAEIRAWNVELQERVEHRTRKLKEAHQRLLHSEKVAATGTFSAGVASEVNNPLTSVLGILQLLLGRTRKDPARARDAELLQSGEKEALRIRGVMRRMQSLSQRLSALQFTRIRVNDLLSSTLELLKVEHDLSRIQMERAFTEDLPQVRGGFMQLQQAVLQVLANAVTATGGEGRIVISTLLGEGNMVRIVVSDDGCGIVPDDLDKIFEPFFTTGDASEGAGLGLAIAQRIIEEHHGTISAKSKVDEGTVVSIALPVAE